MPIPPTEIIMPVGGLPIPVSKVTIAGILGKICGEGNEILFVGLTDLLQGIVDFFIPNIWPLTMLEDMFNDVFDNLQENLKPFAYNQGVAMGDRIEGQVEAWIKGKFDKAMSELEKARDQALGQIAQAEQELKEHTEKIQNLIERVGELEGKSGFLGGLFQQ